MQCLLKIGACLDGNIEMLCQLAFESTTPSDKGVDLPFRQRLRVALTLLSTLGFGARTAQKWREGMKATEAAVVGLAVTGLQVPDEKVRVMDW